MANPFRDLKLRWRLHETVQPLILGEPNSGPVSRSRVRAMMSSVRHARAVQIDLLKSRAGAAADQGRLTAMRKRLLVVAPELVPGWREESAAGLSTAALIERLAAVANGSDRAARWLFYIGMAGAFPTIDSLRAFERALRLSSGGDVVGVVVEHALAEMATSHSHYRRLHLVTDGVLADVDFCATHAFNSGIQRVVRNTLERWTGRHECTLVAWDPLGIGMRLLTAKETRRVLSWGRAVRSDNDEATEPDAQGIVVPWRSTILLPETSARRFSPRLAALAEYSGNTTVALAYDAIPLSNGSFVTTDESLTFAEYLNVVKRVDRVVPISEAAAEEFRGFRDALGAQGKQGPVIETVELPESGIAAPGAGVGLDRPHLPIVLCVGSFEARKNQLAVLDAAEILWRKGLRFQLVMMGGSAQSWYKDIDARLAQRVLEGRPISRLTKVSERTLAAAYGAARFSVFVSLHEGYGLPVVESLAAGTPVVATAYGSVGDIARRGGCLLADPRDLDSIADAMERLLTDDAALERLVAEIDERPKRTWDDYAEEIWSTLEKTADAVKAGGAR